MNPLITGVITHLLSGMSHQVDPFPVFLWDQKFNTNSSPQRTWLKSPALQDLAKAHSEVAFYEEVLSKSQLKSGRLKSCP